MASKTDRQIVEMAVRIGLCGLLNKLNDALQVKIEEGVAAGGDRSL